MKPEFVRYLESIDASRVVRERIATIYDFYRRTCPEEITGIFVTDYIKEDGTRTYENLWFFSGSFVMEAKNFLAEDDFDLATLEQPPVYLTVKKKDYDFTKATDKSRLYLDFYLAVGSEFRATLKASRENCDFLRDIISTYLLLKANG